MVSASYKGPEGRELILGKTYGKRNLLNSLRTSGNQSLESFKRCSMIVQYIICNSSISGKLLFVFPQKVKLPTRTT